MLLNLLEEFEPPQWPTPPPRRRWPEPDAPVRDEPGATRDAVWRTLTLLLESLDGRRPLTQLRDLLPDPVYEAMATRVRGTTGHRHRLVSLHTCRVSPVAVEVAATVRRWPPGKPETWRARALAGRVELVQESWRFTALRLLG